MSPSNNPDGRPSKGLTEATQIVRGPAELIKAARTAAEKEGIAISEWWRRAAVAYLKRSTLLNRTPRKRSISFCKGCDGLGRVAVKVPGSDPVWTICETCEGTGER